MFNYYVMVRKIQDHYDRDTHPVRALTKKKAISKIIKQLKNDKRNIEELEVAVFDMEEYRNLRYDEITNSKRFNLLSSTN